MPVLFMYLIKLSLSLAVVYAFYQLVLRRLTFYTWNRWYLAGYTALCFFIPFIDISIVLERNDWSSNQVLKWVPMVEESRALIMAEQNKEGLDGWEISLLLIAAGMVVFLLKLLLQFISFSKLKRRAIPVEHNGTRVYQVNDNIIPFSFGNSIFVNRSLHNDTELQDIIRHEFIHVKQKHSFDIIWSEIFCIINWYNPFAWLIKKAIRQNLEFIADNKVIESGIPKKEYQYLLLKVIGNNQYSIATAFNYSSLKKRIAMMNKLKSTRKQLLRMLFLLPATAILLLAFRNGIIETPGSEDIFAGTASTADLSQNLQDPLAGRPTDIQPREKIMTDTLPGERSASGKLPDPDKIRSIEKNKSIITITGKNGEKVVYNLDLAPEREDFEKKYGKVISPAAPVEVRAGTVEEVVVTGYPSKIAAAPAVTVAGQPLTKIALTQPVTVAGQPLELIATTQPVIVEERRINVAATAPVTTKTIKLNHTVAVSPKLALTTTDQLAPAVVEVVATPTIKTAVSDKSSFLNLGGLTTVNEGQYILIDGKEPAANHNGTIKGTFRITFLDKKEGVKKYGDKGSNGVILLETIKKDNSYL